MTSWPLFILKKIITAEHALWKETGMASEFRKSGWERLLKTRMHQIDALQAYADRSAQLQSAGGCKGLVARMSDMMCTLYRCQ